jgi:hypothetical protein
MTHGYVVEDDAVMNFPHYLLATVAGIPVVIPVSKQVVYAIRAGGEALGLPIEENVDGAWWEIPIGETITRQISMEKARGAI